MVTTYTAKKSRDLATLPFILFGNAFDFERVFDVFVFVFVFRVALAEKGLDAVPGVGDGRLGFADDDAVADDDFVDGRIGRDELHESDLDFFFFGSPFLAHAFVLDDGLVLIGFFLGTFEFRVPFHE